MDKFIGRFFLRKQPTTGENFSHFPPAIPKPVLKHFEWDESTPMIMTYTDTGVLIERDVPNEKE